MIAEQLDQNATQMATTDTSSESQHLLFRSGDDWLAIPAIFVREITASPERVAIPNCHPALSGVCHLGSEFIPVVSIDGLFGATSAANDETQNTLLVINGKATWALLIAEAGSIETLQVVGTAGIEKGGSIEMGTAMFQGDILRVLDPKAVYQQTQLLIESVWRSSDQQENPNHFGENNPSQGANDETK